MPKLAQLLENGITPSGFSYSAVSLSALTASEYTLVSLIIDVSGSTSSFRSEMEKAVGEIVKACQRSPRAQNLMIRVSKFGSTIEEVHGFKLLSMIKPDDYVGQLSELGLTALYQATAEGFESVVTYGGTLMGQNTLANAVAFVITDGGDNIGGRTPAFCKKIKEEAVTKEQLESFTTVLVEIGNDPMVKRFGAEAGFTQVEQIDQATEKTLAKLAAFVSKSISSASQAIGTGGPSHPVPFTL